MARLKVVHKKYFVCPSCGVEIDFDKRILGNTRNKSFKKKKGIFDKGSD